MKNAPVKADLPATRVFLKGMGGEIGRGYYYRNDDRGDRPLSAGARASALVGSAMRQVLRTVHA